MDAISKAAQATLAQALAGEHRGMEAAIINW